MQRSGIVNRITQWEASALVYIAKRDGWEIETTGLMLLRYTALPAITLRKKYFNKYGEATCEKGISSVSDIKRFVNQYWKEEFKINDALS